MCRLLTAIEVYFGSKDSYSEFERDASPAYMRAVRRCYMQHIKVFQEACVNGAVVKLSLKKLHRCDYHEHKDDEEKQVCKENWKHHKKILKYATTKN